MSNPQSTSHTLNWSSILFALLQWLLTASRYFALQSGVGSSVGQPTPCPYTSDGSGSSFRHSLVLNVSLKARVTHVWSTWRGEETNEQDQSNREGDPSVLYSLCERQHTWMIDIEAHTRYIEQTGCTMDLVKCYGTKHTREPRQISESYWNAIEKGCFGWFGSWNSLLSVYQSSYAGHFNIIGP